MDGCVIYLYTYADFTIRSRSSGSPKWECTRKLRVRMVIWGRKDWKGYAGAIWIPSSDANISYHAGCYSIRAHAPRAEQSAPRLVVKDATELMALLKLDISAPCRRAKEIKRIATTREALRSTSRIWRLRSPLQVYLGVQWLQMGNMHRRVKSICEKLFLAS